MSLVRSAAHGVADGLVDALPACHARSALNAHLPALANRPRTRPSLTHPPQTAHVNFVAGPPHTACMYLSAHSSVTRRHSPHFTRLVVALLAAASPPTTVYLHSP
ncbi:hypothetical protein OIV58_31915, partial [Burkholderia pseudomallei]|nr:hypothetical protein [Burkholderia pseudomallei]